MPVPWPPQLMAWYSCGQQLAASLPITQVAIDRTLLMLAAHSADKSPDFLLLATAVMAAESGFNNNAVSSSGAIGLMQLTLIGAREAAKQCSLSRPLGESDSSLTLKIRGPAENVKYGTCLLKHYLKQVNNNSLHALVLYNGGYGQLTRLRNTGTLTEETLNYVLRVHSYLGRCQ